MYCPNCGTQLVNGQCPNCTQTQTQPQTQPQDPVQNSNSNGQKKGLTKQTRTYAAFMTALCVFPATLSIAIDLSFHRYDFWFGYVVGGLIVAWVCAVLPVLKITPAPLTALICFTSIVGYSFFIMKKTGHLEWLFQKLLPLFILFALFVAVDVALFGSKKVKGLFVPAIVSGEIGIYIICMELLRTKSLTDLHWSPIVSAGFISVAIVFAIFGYVGIANKDK